MYAKQVIIVRKDLKMPKGKLAGQVAHASLGALLGVFRKYETIDNTWVYHTEFARDSVLDKWLNGIFTKVILGVNSLEELELIHTEAVLEGLPSSLITDAANTVFKEPTVTCLGIGPYISDELDKLTGHLKLY